MRGGLSDACRFRRGMGGVVGGSGSSPSSKSFSDWLTFLMHSTQPHFMDVHLERCIA